VANYLAGLGSTAALNTVSAGAPAIASGGGSSGLVSALAFGGLGMGSKPKALHTEYATGSANWQKPYGSGTDIVFYLVRADSGKPGTEPTSSSGSTPNSPSRDRVIAPGTQETLNAQGDVSGGGSAVFAATTQTGANLTNNVQTSLNQVAANVTMSGLQNAPAPTPGLAGPLTGLTTAEAVMVGATSQTFATYGNSQQNIENTLQTVNALESLRLSEASSEAYFNFILETSFTGSPVAPGTKSVDQIMASFDSGLRSDLAVGLARASGGVTTSKQLIEGINKGIIGFTSPGSKAEADRLGPQGYSRERLAK
jgi:hypothetical protein